MANMGKEGILISVDPNEFPRVVAAYCKRNHFTGFLADGKTPELPEDFVRRHLIDRLRGDVAGQEGDEAAMIAYQAAADDAGKITIT